MLLLGLVVFKLIGSAASSLFLMLAIVLWIMTLTVLAYEFGWINPTSRVPVLSSMLGFLSARTEVGRDTGAQAGEAPRGELSDEDRAELIAAAQAALGRLVGGEEAVDVIRNRIVGPAEANPDNPFATTAPAAMALFAGPPGTGRTTAAVATARWLAGIGAIKTAKVVTLRGSDLRSGEHGSADALGRAMAEQALDGTLLIDDADWLMEGDPYGGATPPSVDLGGAILAVARRAPGRLFIAVTLGAQAGERLATDPTHRAWVGKLALRRVPFRDLMPEELADLVAGHLDSAGWELEDDALRPVERLMEDQADRAGEGFDNVEACRRIAERLIAAAGNDQEQRRIGRAVVRAVDDEGG
jgi:hypothetical protein